MNYAVVLIIALYIVVVMRLIRRWGDRMILKMEAEMLMVRRERQELLEKKEKNKQEKRIIENKAMEVFTLYEITKDITKSVNEQEAFAVFQKKLREHIYFDACAFFEAPCKEAELLDHRKKGVTFTLREKRKTIGYLVIEGLRIQDRDKFVIMAHQFALALRRVRLYREIERTAITDGLTGVYTRRHIMERLSEELNRSRSRGMNMSFLMMDVDFFKRFNDAHGHLTGDQVLRGVGQVIRQNIREIDIAGRYGGEEFCVVLPDTDRQGAYYAAERIRLAMEKAEISALDICIKATLSIGTATFPEDAEKMDEIIDKADWALYQAKRRGRNCVYAAKGD